MTTETREAASAGPDLSRLEGATRRRLAVAGAVMGAWWERPKDEFCARWWLVVAPHRVVAVVYDDEFEGKQHNLHSLPDWEHDPAAWGALMEKERVWPEPYIVDGELAGWFGMRADRPWGRERATALADSPGAAVELAVLAKYGRSVPT